MKVVEYGEREARTERTGKTACAAGAVRAVAVGIGGGEAGLTETGYSASERKCGGGC